MKTAMAFILARIEMLYIEKDSVHWEMYKNDCMEKEKEQMIDFAYGCTQHISKEDIEEYYNKTFNPTKEEQLAFLVKQAQGLDLGYQEFELGGEG
jgi:hypothetical protein